MTSRLRSLSLALLLCATVGGMVVGLAHWRTEQDIAAFEERIATLGGANASPTVSAQDLAALPAPVQRYFRYTFPEGVPRYKVVRLAASGQFRRPGTSSFAPTTARQVIAAGVPALMFSATTPIVPGVWARAYDFFAEGDMEMKAKILSTITVVDEGQSPTLNQISLRRWLLESALYPVALLPGGPVRWEALNEHSARAVVTWAGMQASMVAHFSPEGMMTAMESETDGDLSTPYHGSGEHVTRSNYQRQGLQMLPMDFTISRRAQGKLHPFWKGRIDSISAQ